MTSIKKIDILIIGSGPAGMSTALHLLQANKAWANRVMVVDKAIHPREKLCGGGVTPAGEHVLQHLGLSFEPPHVSVQQVRFAYQDADYTVYDTPCFRVTRRDEFDHWLVQCGEKRGLTVRQGEAVKDITVTSDYVEVITERATIHAQVVVAADGSLSFVRRKLKWNHQGRKSRLLEVLTPESKESRAFQDRVAVFDFSQLRNGLQGYYWEFPSLIKGQAYMNRGVFDSRIRSERSRVPLKQMLAESMAKEGKNLADYKLKGHPIHWFTPEGSFSQPRIILVGDAAGVDPLFGEGISFALAYGDVAAAAMRDAFSRQDFSFNDYRARILSHPFLSKLSIRARLASLLYSAKPPWQIKLLWKMTTGVLTWAGLVHKWLGFEPSDLPLRSTPVLPSAANCQL